MTVEASPRYSVHTTKSVVEIVTGKPAAASGLTYSHAELPGVVNVKTALDAIIDGIGLADEYVTVDTAQTITGMKVFQSVSSFNQGLQIKGALGQSASLQTWLDSAGVVVGGVGPNGRFGFGGAPDGSYGGLIRSVAAGTVVTAIRGAVSQAADLTRWEDSAGAVLARVTNTGEIRTASGMYTFPRTAATVPMIVQGATSQTADLTQWQNSAGGVLASIQSGGAVRIEPTGGVAGVGGSVLIFPSAAGDIGVRIRGKAAQGNDLQTWEGSAGAILAKVTAAGKVAAPYFDRDTETGAYISMGQTVANAVTIVQRAAANQALVVRGFASQTADLQQWQDSAGTVLASVSAGGHIIATNGSITTANRLSVGDASVPAGVSARIKALSATTIGAIVQGAAAQTGDLQQWQNSAGTAQDVITAAGHLGINSASPPATAQLYISSDAVGNNQIQTIGGNSFAATVLALDVNRTGTSAYKFISAISGADDITPVTTFEVRGDGQTTHEVSAATVTPMILKGAVSQTANLQEWRNSAGTVLAFVQPGGEIRSSVNIIASNNITGKMNIGDIGSGVPGIIFGNLGDTNLYRSAADTLKTDDTLHVSNRLGVGITPSSVIGGYFRAPTAADKTVVVISQSGQTGNLQEWQDSAGASLVAIDSAGRIAPRLDIRSARTTGTSVSALNLSDSVVGMQAAGFGNKITFSSNNGSLVAEMLFASGGTGTNNESEIRLRTQNAAGGLIDGLIISSLGHVTSKGRLQTSGDGALTNGGVILASASDTVGYAIYAKSPAATHKTIIARGAASQTASLQEWQDSVGAVLAQITAAGAFAASGTVKAWRTGVVSQGVELNGGDAGGSSITSFGTQKNFTINNAADQLEQNSLILATNGVGRAWFSAKNIGLFLTPQTDGDRVITLGNAVTVPTTNPVGGGVLYSEAGALKWRGSAGTVTTLAAA